MDTDFKPAKRPAKSVQATPTDPNTSESFQTPAEAAAADDVTQTPVVPADPSADTPAAKPPQPGGVSGSTWKDKLRLSWPPGKKEYITAAVAILLIAGGAAAYLLTRPDPKPATVHKTVQKTAPKPTTVPSTLSGLPVDPSINKRPVTGVMVENSMDARPQSGLGQASVVFEAIAEGGITRFLALFQDTQPSSIGPVRSARPYYIQWLLGFDAGYAHVGGSPDALSDIKAWNVRDLDQFYNAGAYQRVSNRAAPHNVYTSIDALQQLEAKKGWTSSTFNGFIRKKEAPTKQPPTARVIDMAISGPLYNVHYDYDATSNSYKRSEGGAPHIDAGTNTQISPKVVVALVMPYSLAGDGYHSQYSTLGSGTAIIFQDGVSTTGTWSKPDNTSQFTFTDSAGQPLGLDPGQTWLTAVGSAGAVTSGP
jgi:hypothetical protein